VENEYLFLTDEHRATVEEYEPSDVIKKIDEIKHTRLWTVSFSISDSDSDEESAKKLSDVHTYMMQYSLKILSCESSEYYNKTLFPLVNTLERKLRKLLYLASAISDDSDNKEAKERIKLLEEQDFGQIFERLFFDDDFIDELKAYVNGKTRSVSSGKSKFTKSQIKTLIDSLNENILWNKILCENDVPTLQKSFNDVRLFRNKVMHAHNIDSEEFDRSNSLFNKVNGEIDKAISRLIDDAESHKIRKGVNKAISAAFHERGIPKMYKPLHYLNISEEVARIYEKLHGIFIPSFMEAQTDYSNIMKNYPAPLLKKLSESANLQNLYLDIYRGSLGNTTGGETTPKEDSETDADTQTD
jgi:hypothetical protein